MKVGIVGVGAVGSACLLSLVTRGIARHIVLVDRDRARARGVAADVQYGAVLSPAVEVRDGDYSDLAGAELVMIAAGVNEKNGGATNRGDPAGRLRLFETNVGIYQEIVPQVLRATPDTMILVITDPPDPMADVVRPLGHPRVLSTGTLLDTLRFRFHLARYLKLSPASVEAQVLGEHGTSAVFLWSSARIGGRPVLQAMVNAGHDPEELHREIEHEVRYANITIIEGIGASQYGIGMVSARIAEMVLRDERRVVPIGAYSSKYGVTFSLPSVLGRDGVAQVLEPEMSDEERRGIERSAETLHKVVARLDMGTISRKTA